MARQLKWWIAATTAACAAVGFVYLPPRSAPLLHRPFPMPEPPTPYRLRVQALAASWRQTSLQLQLLDSRDRLRPELEWRRTHEVPGPAVLFLGDMLSDSAQHLVIAALDSVWSRLGLGVTKVSVGVVLVVGRERARTGEPSEKGPQWLNAYLLPDSSERSICVARLSLPVSWGMGKLLAQPRPALHADFSRWVQNGLGPCAFYAGFGSPGRNIGRWLGTRSFDLALYPWWDHDGRAEPQMLHDQYGNLRRLPWFWWVQSLAPGTIACLAGREPGCRAAVLSGAGRSDTIPSLITTEFWWRRQWLLGGDHYLADVAREIGRERFGRFWNSELPVDTALAVALRMPVGAWTARWQRQIAPRIRLGPAAPPGAVFLGLLLAAVALPLAARAGARREVR